MINRTVWVIVLAAITAGGYTLHRSGYLTVEKARSYISGFSMNQLLSANGPEQTTSDAPEAPKTAEPSAPLPEEIVSEPSYEAAQPTSSDEARTETAPQEAPSAAVEKVEAQRPAEPEPVEQIQEEAVASAEPVQESNVGVKEEIQLLLPTRWPVEYASGYRMRDPNGVVVDVPGGLVKHEGWLDLDDVSNSPLIRSIKAVQRETGARFIVRINGDLPRFMTAPKTDGVFLTLYYNESSDFGPSEKVAMAE